MKSQKLLESFTAYCKQHPEERFWQALRNWCGWPFVIVSTHQLWLGNDELGSGEDADKDDTFYWENNKKPFEQ